MQRELGLRFQVKNAAGAFETLIVDADRALIGAAAHCEVRLPPTEAAHEHVAVIATPHGVQLATCAGVTPPMLDGAQCIAGAWPRGAVLTIGHTAIVVEAIDLGIGERGRSPFWALAPVPVLAALAIFFATRAAPAATPPIPQAPALLDAPVTACPAPTSPTLPGFAAERARVGLSKRERSPFSPADGIEAVGLLETASACYRAAGMAGPEKDTARAAQTLRTRLDQEYHVRRVRVEHAFNVGDPAAAKRELIVLMPMLAHRHGAYFDWLASVDRYATSALESKNWRKL